MPIILNPPAAKNYLTSDRLYEERLKYKNKISGDGAKLKLIDLWYEKPFYGKVDIYGNPVWVTENFIKPIAGQNQNAIKFVADAFTHFRKFVLDAAKSGRTQLKDYLGPMVPQASWSPEVDISYLYHTHWESAIFDPFVNTFLQSNHYKKRVHNFGDFIKSFLEFCIIMKGEAPITKTSFITSRYCPHTSTGLFIDLQNTDQSNDAIKYNKYYSKFAFYEYIKTAASFGFYVDKNAPWVLVANLASSKMREYADAYGLTISDNGLFTSKHYYSRQYDYHTLKALLYGAYKSYIARHPNMKLIKTCQSGVNLYDGSRLNYETITQTIKRESIPTPYGEFVKSKVYDDRYFLDLFFKIRLLESRLDFSQNKYNTEYKKVLVLLKNKGIAAATKRIDLLTKRTRIYKRTDDAGKFELQYLSSNTKTDLPFAQNGDIVGYGSSTAY